ncbi:MAG: protein kinase domain-containing protein, partial [Planctomycetota bacterium]
QPSPDDLTSSRYERLEELGRGGAAVVYKAWDRDLGRAVAVKVLKEEVGSNPVTRERFLREARAAGAMSHPNLVSVYDVGEEEGQMYLVMELVEGKSLADVMADGRLGLKPLLYLLEKVSRGVGAAHEKGVIHRDLKPANILLSADREPKVGDFGLAHLADSETELTRTGAVLGTPLYMAPEQVEGRKGEIAPPTDVYALGVVLYEILTGRPPHMGESAMELYGKIVNVEPERPRKVNSSAPVELETICLKAIEKEASRRYADGTEFAEDLRRYLEGEPIAARPATMRYRLWKRVRKNRVTWSLGATAVLVGVLGVAAVVLIIWQSNNVTYAAEYTVRAERMYDAGNYPEAKRLANKALQWVEGYEPARYWLVRLDIREYQSLRGVPEARPQRGLMEIVPARPENDGERWLREKIEQDLQGMKFAGMKSRAIVEGVLLLWKGRYAEALKKFDEVPKDAAGAWEAECYSATAHYLMGEFEQAEERLSRRRGRDPGVTMPVWIRTLIAKAQLQERAGGDPEKLYYRALGACYELGGRMGRLLEAQTLVARGKAQGLLGKDPEEDFKKAVERLEGLGEIEAHIARGDAHLAWAEHLRAKGTPEPARYDAAVAAYGGAEYAPAFVRRAEAHLARGPGKEDLERARDDYAKALELVPSYTIAVIGLAEAKGRLRRLEK